jgi:chaperonin cofactor prefoldin
MKCDELQYERLGDANKTYQASTLVIRKQFVDAAITELKAIIHELESIPHTDNSAVIERLSNENERLKAKLESVQATAYTESVDAGMRERRLKRALWLSRAERAKAIEVIIDHHVHNEILHFTSKRDELGNPKGISRTAMEWWKMFKEVERKCNMKAEEYK